MIRCIDEAKEQVRRETGLSVTDAQVERVLAGQSCSMDENARSVIQKQGGFTQKPCCPQPWKQASI